MSPIRTCLVTGEKREQKEFLRFTVQRGSFVFDEKKKNPGRGGYVLSDFHALEKLPKMAGKIVHFLHVSGKINFSAVEEQKKKFTPSSSPPLGSRGGQRGCSKDSIL